MTNREEVAKKLRAKYKERTMPGLFEPQDVYFYTLNYLKDLEKCLPDGESAFTVLADLIDPTCHMSWEYGNGDDDTDEYMELIVDTPEDTVACHCHACDIVFRFERNIVPDYCPNCGARVVRDEA